MTVTILNYKPLNKSSILGIFSVYVPQFGLEIFGLTHFKKDAKEWVNLPSKEVVKDEEKKWVSVIRFKERSASDAFQRACLQSIKNFQIDEAKDRKPMSNDQEEFPF